MVNSDNISIFVRAELQEERKVNQLLDTLIQKFKSYIGGTPNRLFGKDVPYHDPKPYAEKAGLRHVHILNHVHTIRLHSTSTSDSVIIYTEASMHPNTYYIIDYLADNAHERARDPILEWLISKAKSSRMRKQYE